MASQTRILIIDGQGGRIGSRLVSLLKEQCPHSTLTAVGTNSMATASMIKAGAQNAATGENAVVVNARRADVIVGPIGIVIADALLGEITPAMAVAVGQSPAEKILIPVNRCENQVVGVENLSVNDLLGRAVEMVRQIAENNGD